MSPEALAKGEGDYSWSPRYIRGFLLAFRSPYTPCLPKASFQRPYASCVAADDAESVSITAWRVSPTNALEKVYNPTPIPAALAAPSEPSVVSNSTGTPVVVAKVL